MRSVLSGAESFKFKDIEMLGVLESWEDDLPIRLASYEYLKRDGAEKEPMGAGAKRWSFHCCLIGPTCGASYKRLAATIQQDPRGPLNHPRLGFFNAACSGLKARENPGQAIDVIEFTLDLEENQVDQAIRADAQFGAQARGSQVQDALLRVASATSVVTQNRIANAVYAAAVAGVATLNALADKFRLLALQISQSAPGTLASDPTLLSGESLDKLLGQVLTQRDTALAALTATTAKTLEPDISLTDARTAVYLVYAASLQLYQTVRSQLPPVVDFIVPTAMSADTILVRIYGKDAKKQSANFYALNKIPSPYWIPGGTKLRVFAPEVSQ